MKPRLGQGRAGLRCKIKTPISKPLMQVTEKPPLKVILPNTSKIQDRAIPIPNYAIPHVKPKGDISTKMIDRKTIQDVCREIPSIQIQFIDPHQNQLTCILEIPGSLSDIDPELNTDSEDSSPFQQGVISEMYQSPDKSYFQQPQELEGLINTGRLVQKFLLKQADIDKILLKIIQSKVIKVMHLPATVNKIQAEYLISSYFKDLYLYLAQNKLPSTKTVIQKVEMLA